MIGYIDNGYRLWDPIRKKVVHARNVIFEEIRSRNEVIIKENTDSDASETEANNEEIKPAENRSKLDKKEENLRKSTRRKQLPKYLADCQIPGDYSDD